MTEKIFLSFRISFYLGGWGYYFEVMFGNFGKIEFDFFFIGNWVI